MGSALYRILLRVLPRSMRIAAEEELTGLFAERLARARQQGGASVARLWIIETADLFKASIAERRNARRRAGTAPASVSRALPKFVRDFAWSLRQLLRAPRALLLAVVTLALGIAASTTAFVLVRDILVRPLPFRQPDQLVRLVELDENRRNWWPSYPNCADWRRIATGVFDALGCADPDRPKPVIVGGAAVKARAARASAGLFEALAVRPSIGRLFSADETRAGGAPAAIVSHRFWRDVLGARPLETLTMTVGDAAAPVVGVLPPEFSFLGWAGSWSSPDVWTPLERDLNLGGRRSHGYHTVGRLRAGVTVAEATGEMARLSKILQAEHAEPTHADSVGISPLKNYVTREAISPLRILSWAAAAVLLVSCFNFGATLLARGLARQRELRMRLALGATRADLLRLMLADAAALAVPATMVGLGLSAGFLAWMRYAAAGSLPRMSTVALDWPAATLAVLAAFVSAVVAAVAPALTLSMRALAGGLASRGTVGASRSAQRLWSSLIAAQLGLTLVLLAETGLLVRSFVAASTVDVGYHAEDVLAIDLTVPPTAYATDESLFAFYQTVSDRLRGIPGVAAVGLTSVLPFDTQSAAGGTSATGLPAPPGYLAAFRLIHGDYFKAMGIGVHPGADVLSPGRAYIDDAVAKKLWGGQSPVGGEVRNTYPGVSMRVAGVVAATRQWSDDAGTGVIYAPLGGPPGVLTTMHAVVRFSGAKDTAVSAARQAVMSVNPLVPAEPQWMSSLAGDALQTRRVLLVVALAFTGIAFVLASAGTYAMVLFAVRRRMREAAIRIALGAAARDVRSTFLRIGLAPSAVGLIAGALATRPAGALVAAQLFHVQPGDPVVLASAIIALTGAALAAAMLPARRAAQADPATLLRDE